MNRVEMISQQGRHILLIDLSQIHPEEGLAVINTSQKLIAAQPAHSLLTLTDVTQAHYDVSLVQALKEFAKHNEPFVRAGAVVGAEGMMKIILEAVEKFSGRNFSVFGSRAEAEAWLVRQ